MNLLTDNILTINLVGSTLVFWAVGRTYLLPRLHLEPRLASSAQAALAGQPCSTSEFLPLAVAPTVAALLLVVNVVLGLFKPGTESPGGGGKESR